MSRCIIEKIFLLSGAASTRLLIAFRERALNRVSLGMWLAPFVFGGFSATRSDVELRQNTVAHQYGISLQDSLKTVKDFVVEVAIGLSQGVGP
jgi:hypothetical protein